MNKTELTKKAESLGVDVKSTWTNKEIEAAIAEKESNVVTTTDDFNNPVVEGKPAGDKNADSEIEPERDDEHPENELKVDPDDEDDDNTDAPEEEKPKAKSDEVVVKYVGTSKTYQIGKHKFSLDSPFVVLSKEDFDKIGEDNVDLEKASKSDVNEYYK